MFMSNRKRIEMNIQVISYDEGEPTSRRRGAADTPQPRWLTPGQLDGWKSVPLMRARLLTALETQLQRDAQLSYVEYYVLAGLSDQAEHTMRMSQLAILTNAELSRLSH